MVSTKNTNDSPLYRGLPVQEKAQLTVLILQRLLVTDNDLQLGELTSNRILL